MTAVLDEMRCRCGHRVKWIIDAPDTERGQRMESDVTKVPCPHGTFTTSEHCPLCGRVVYATGFSPAGEPDCPCWDQLAWAPIRLWRVLRRRIRGERWPELTTG